MGASSTFLAEASVNGFRAGDWSIDLTGTYDPETGEMSGDASFSAFGRGIGISGDIGDSAQVVGVITLAGQSQPFTADFR